MIIDMGYWNKVIRRVIGLALTIVGICLAIKLSVFYTPFLIAIAIAMLIEPLIKWTSKKTKLERKKTAIIVLVLVFAIIIGILVLGITTLISEASNLLSGLNGYIDIAYAKVQEFTQYVKFDGFENKEELNTILQNATRNLLETISNIITSFLQTELNALTSLPEIGIYTVITIIATYFMCTDRLYMLDQLEHHLPKSWVRKIGIHVREIASYLGSYLKAEFILIGIDFLIVLVGLLALNFLGFNIEYPLLVALGIGFVDALPLVGSGTAMVPWAVVSALNGDLRLAISILVLFAIIIIVRQLLEPKIVSSQIGIHPIFTLISMYTGYKFIGVLGMLIGPIILIILKSIFGRLIDKGILKTIFDRR